MSVRYACGNENRRRLVSEHPPLNGIDHLEVMDEAAEAWGLPRQQFLLVRFLRAIPEGADAWSEAEVALEAEPGAAPVGVVWARRAPDITTALIRDPESSATLSPAQRDGFHALEGADRILVVLTDGVGDYSTYTLRLVRSATDDSPPEFVDPPLARVAFSFKVECPSDFDCAPEEPCPPPVRPEPVIDYLARDYAGFRRLMMDRLSVVMPGYREESPADLQVTLVELLAYVGDYLSYQQDAVATEAYLGTARRRTSVRRHARLLDYRMHEGCNARTWVHFEVTGGAVEVPTGTELRTRDEDDEGVFETMHDAVVHSAHNRLVFHTWGDLECCLPAGSTRATLQYDAAVVPEEGRLAPGSVLIFEEVVSPTTGLPADADVARRHPVRLTEVVPGADPLDGTPVTEVAWHEADALPFPLCLSARVGNVLVDEVSVARGNVVLADHGRTMADAPWGGSAGATGPGTTPLLDPDVVPGSGRFRPRLQFDPLTFASELAPVLLADGTVRLLWDEGDARGHPARDALLQDPRTALPTVVLEGAGEWWTPRPDLLASDRFAPEFVAEVETDAQVTLRFGDGVLGRAPEEGTVLRARYRVGNGPSGNVGAEALARVRGIEGIRAVRNPLPAVGGTAPESLEEVRQYAPQAFRTQERAVTAEDYAEVTARHPEVQRAAASFRWTGSWTTVFVTVDRRGGLPVQGDPVFRAALREHIERYRLAGYDLEVQDPVWVSVDLALDVCVNAGYFRSDVAASLLEALGRFDLPGGGRGFFHPDRFTFGQPLWLSQIYAAAMAVEGVDSVEVRRFRRWGEGDRGEREAGVLTTAPLEIVRLDNDPSRPDRGVLTIDLQGGL